jgi:hypothetical protein
MRILALLAPLFALVVVVWNRSEAAQAAPAAGDPALFEPIASVLTHPRCINCHQAESPTQTDAKILHRPLMVRGANGHGSLAQPCQTCHQTTNTADGFVPGVPDWHLAPLSMLWEGKTKGQICEQMKDPARNGGRHTGAEIIEHMKVDPLVLWAWNPGAKRTTPPLSHAQLVKAAETWVAAGMPCPPGG